MVAAYPTKPTCTPYNSRRACMQAATQDKKQYIETTCKPIMSGARRRAAPKPTVNTTTMAKCVQQMPNNNYTKRVEFLKDILKQGEKGTLIPPGVKDRCGPVTAYFDFLVELTVYIAGNIGTCLGSTIGPAIGQAVGASYGQSVAFASGGPIAEILGTLIKEALGLGDDDEPTEGPTTRRHRREPAVGAIPLTRPLDTTALSMVSMR